MHILYILSLFNGTGKVPLLLLKQQFPPFSIELIAYYKLNWEDISRYWHRASFFINI